MTTTLDIAICLDCSRSMESYMREVRSHILSFVSTAVSCRNNDIRLSLIKFQTHTDDYIIHVNSFTSSFETFEKWISDAATTGSSFDETKGIVDALDASLKLNWRSDPDDHNSQNHEKLVILITDGPPCDLLNDNCPHHNQDLWKLSNEFDEQNIILVVLGVETGIVLWDDFYYALANKTGGEYIPIQNASEILSSVIETILLEEDTILQAFRHIDMKSIQVNSSYHHSLVQKRAEIMIKQCQTMADIRRKLYKYDNQTVQRQSNANTNNHDFRFCLQAIDTDYLDDLSIQGLPIIAMTPITDDEGYRTRLPTVASIDSNSIRFIDSPIDFLNASNSTDDECF